MRVLRALGVSLVVLSAGAVVVVFAVIVADGSSVTAGNTVGNIGAVVALALAVVAGIVYGVRAEAR